VKKRRKKRQEELQESLRVTEKRTKVARKVAIANVMTDAQADMTTKGTNTFIVADPPTTIARARTVQRAMLKRQLHLSSRRPPNNLETSMHHLSITPRVASLTSPKHKQKTCWIKNLRPKMPTESLVTYLVSNELETVIIALEDKETGDLAMATNAARVLIEWIENVSETEIEGMKVIIGGRETLLVDGTKGGVVVVVVLVVVVRAGGSESLVLVVDDSWTGLPGY